MNKFNQLYMTAFTVGLGLPLLGHGNQEIPSDLRAKLEQRELWASKRTFRYQAQVNDETDLSVAFSSKPPSELVGTKPSELEIVHKSKKEPLVYSTEFLIANQGDHVVVKERWKRRVTKQEGSQFREVVEWFSSITEHRGEIAIFSTETGDSKFDIVEVWKSPIPGFRILHPRSPLLRAECHAFLASRDPLRMYQSEWQVIEETDHHIRLYSNKQISNHSSYDSEYSNRHLWLSKAHDGAPLRYEYIPGIEKKGSPVWHVKKFRQIDGFWIPEEIECVRNIFGKETTLFRLVEVKPTESDLDGSFEKAIPAFDFRLAQPVIFPDDYHQNSGKGVRYMWTGQLPSDSELRKMALEQGKLPKESGGVRFSWLLLLPGVLLAGGAVVMYLLRKEVS